MNTKISGKKPDREIVALARLVLNLLTSTSNILVAIEELKKFFPRLKLKVVDDELLPDTEAHAYPKRWTIRIRRGIYEGLLRGHVRGRWTLVHELGHVLLQHPGRPARAREVIEEEYTKAGRVEREADIFTRSVLMPFDRFADFSSEQIRKDSGVSSKSASRRVAEFAKAKDIRAALWRRGLDVRIFTSEFGHQNHLERQTAVAAQAMSEILEAGQEENAKLIGPINENLFSTAVTVAAASGLLLNAYESIRRDRSSSMLVAPSVLALSIIAICPLRPLGSRSKRSTANSNMKCAMNAALKLAGLPQTEIDLPHFLRTENRQAPYACDYLRKVESLGVELIANASTVLTLENFPTYETYNADHDISWDDVHEIEYLADYFYVLSRSSRK